MTVGAEASRLTIARSVATVDDDDLAQKVAEKHAEVGVRDRKSLPSERVDQHGAAESFDVRNVLERPNLGEHALSRGSQSPDQALAHAAA